MEFMEVVNTRRSIRHFEDRPVEAELVDKVIAAGMTSPSAGNQQPWHFVVVTEREKLDAIPDVSPYAKMAAEAPVAIVLCGASDGTPWPDLIQQDLGACAQTMLLAARDLGLGSVWTAAYPLADRMEGLRALFGIPEDVIPFAVIPMGWPEGEFKSVDRFKAERIHRGVW